MIANIFSQKETANHVLKKLELLDPTCILAGGAPRDWYLGRAANDLDFYLYYRGTVGQLERAFDLMGIQAEPMRLGGHNVRAKLESMYQDMPELRCVYQGVDERTGMPLQFIIMNEPTYRGVVEDFACSTSEFWYKGWDIHYTARARKSVETKTVFVKKGYGIKHAYIQKMRDRFYDYKFIFEAFELPANDPFSVSY